jgi:hypothetical protein
MAQHHGVKRRRRLREMRGEKLATRQSTDDGATQQPTDDGATRQSTDDGATMSWHEEADAVEEDERGRSHAMQQSADGATRDEGADNAQGKEDGSSLPSSAATESKHATGSTEVDKVAG